jgi:hypothetical protein
MAGDIMNSASDDHHVSKAFPSRPQRHIMRQNRHQNPSGTPQLPPSVSATAIAAASEVEESSGRSIDDRNS